MYGPGKYVSEPVLANMSDQDKIIVHLELFANFVHLNMTLLVKVLLSAIWVDNMNVYTIEFMNLAQFTMSPYIEIFRDCISPDFFLLENLYGDLSQHSHLWSATCSTSWNNCDQHLVRPHFWFELLHNLLFPIRNKESLYFHPILILDLNPHLISSCTFKLQINIPIQSKFSITIQWKFSI